LIPHPDNIILKPLLRFGALWQLCGDGLGGVDGCELIQRSKNHMALYIGCSRSLEKIASPFDQLNL
jgi:hypothetical protein